MTSIPTRDQAVKAPKPLAGRRAHELGDPDSVPVVLPKCHSRLYREEPDEDDAILDREWEAMLKVGPREQVG